MRLVRKSLNVLSLCDGMSCGHLALDKCGFHCLNYFSSEIDKNSIKVTKDNYPDTIQLGDVTGIDKKTLENLPRIDLVMFGFPCRSFSKAPPVINRTGLDGVSGLFYSCNNILQWVLKNNNPKCKFLVENVDTYCKDDVSAISECLGVRPVLIDSCLFSAQERKRLYWTNIPIPTLPISNDLVIKDILDSEIPDKYWYDQPFDWLGDNRVCCKMHLKTYDMLNRVYNINYKSPTLTSCRGGYKEKKIYVEGKCRKLTPNEYRKLQTVPDWYVMDVSDSAAYNMLGDAWTIDVVAHILSGLKL